VPTSTPTEQRSAAAAWPQHPILCRYRRWRLGLLGDHRDHLAEYDRARLAGRVPDELWAAAMAVEARLDRSDLAR